MISAKFEKKLDEPIVVVRVPHQAPATVRIWSTLERWLDEQDDAGFGGWLDEQLEAGESSSTAASARRCVERYINHDSRGSTALDATVLADYVEMVGEFAFGDLSGGHLWTIDEAIEERGERRLPESDRNLRACGSGHQSATILGELAAALDDEWCHACALGSDQATPATTSRECDSGLGPVWRLLCESCAEVHDEDLEDLRRGDADDSGEGEE